MLPQIKVDRITGVGLVFGFLFAIAAMVGQQADLGRYNLVWLTLYIAGIAVTLFSVAVPTRGTERS